MSDSGCGNAADDGPLSTDIAEQHISASDHHDAAANALHELSFAVAARAESQREAAAPDDCRITAEAAERLAGKIAAAAHVPDADVVASSSPSDPHREVVLSACTRSMPPCMQ